MGYAKKTDPNPLERVQLNVSLKTHVEEWMKRLGMCWSMAVDQALRDSLGCRQAPGGGRLPWRAASADGLGRA